METNEKALFLKFVGKVEKRSREKHPEKDWRTMQASYVHKKVNSHLDKWWFRRNGDPRLHCAKMAWYWIRMIWIHTYRDNQDDRPHKPKESC